MDSIGWFSFFTDPWVLGLAQWTLGTILSAILQIVGGFIGVMVASLSFWHRWARWQDWARVGRVLVEIGFVVLVIVTLFMVWLALKS